MINQIKEILNQKFKNKQEIVDVLMFLEIVDTVVYSSKKDIHLFLIIAEDKKFEAIFNNELTFVEVIEK